MYSQNKNTIGIVLIQLMQGMSFLEPGQIENWQPIPGLCHTQRWLAYIAEV